MNVIVYCRVSSDEQTLGSSLQVQEERICRYCEAKDYNIIKVYKEDESAKTFEKRPEMMRIVDYIKKNKRKVQKLLFLRWDRFSRDLTSAMQYIQWFRQHDVEPNAVECIIDYDNEMWSLMLGMQIGLAQSDNIKRSKATRDGIHGTLKQGKCSNKAPRGYKNVRTSKHDTHVEIDEAKAKVIRRVFQEVAKGVEMPSRIRKRMCPYIPDSSFFDMLRNVFYIGKIRVPAYKSEPEQIVDGQHESIIDEETFYTVQDILDGKRKKTPKMGKTANPDLFLRKFLKCPTCGHAITGSTSKGNGGSYTYYHCSDSSKHIRVRANEVNDNFIRYVSQLKPRKEVLELYKEILIDIHSKSEKEKMKEIELLNEELMKINVKRAKVEDMYIEGDIDKEDYTNIKSRLKIEVEKIKQKIELIKNVEYSDIKKKLHYSIELLDNIGEFIKNAPVAIKIKVLGSMFPSKIIFDGKNYRTNEYNKILDLIYHETKYLRGEEIQKKEEDQSSSDSVPRAGLEPAHREILVFETNASTNSAIGAFIEGIINK